MKKMVADRLKWSATGLGNICYIIVLFGVILFLLLVGFDIGSGAHVVADHG